MSARALYKTRPAGSLKEAEAGLVTACGGLKCVAALLGISKALAGRMSDSDFSGNFRVDQVITLEAHCGEPIVTRYMALACGHFVEPIRANDSEPIALALGRITEDTGKLLSAAAQDVQDGRLTRSNAQTILRETDDLLPAVAELRASCRAACEARA